jgi:hypothetical protein
MLHCLNNCVAAAARTDLLLQIKLTLFRVKLLLITLPLLYLLHKIIPKICFKELKLKRLISLLYVSKLILLLDRLILILIIFLMRLLDRILLLLKNSVILKKENCRIKSTHKEILLLS